MARENVPASRPAELLGAPGTPAPAAVGISRGGNVVAGAQDAETVSDVLTGSVPDLPAPGAEHRGKMVRVEGGAGTPDRLFICVFICERDAIGKFAWRPL